MMKRAAFAVAALAASRPPALAHVAPWSSPDSPPLAVQFLVSIVLMAAAAAVTAWRGAALVREWKRRRTAGRRPRAGRCLRGSLELPRQC